MKRKTTDVVYVHEFNSGDQKWVCYCGQSDCPNTSPVSSPESCADARERALRARVAELEDDFAKRQASHCCPTWNDQMEDCDCDERMGGHIARWQEAEAEVARLRALLMQWRGALVKWAPTRAEATAVLAGAPPLDSDGHCTTCGLAPEEGVTHECPPGFAAPAPSPCVECGSPIAPGNKLLCASCCNPQLTAPAPLSERERATKEALEECLEALEQAFVDEANCNGLHVPRAHGPRSPNDCFDLWAKQPQHQAALKAGRAALEPYTEVAS